jgi:hypothetical protein
MFAVVQNSAYLKGVRRSTLIDVCLGSASTAALLLPRCCLEGKVREQFLEACTAPVQHLWGT